MSEQKSKLFGLVPFFAVLAVLLVVFLVPKERTENDVSAPKHGTKEFLKSSLAESFRDRLERVSIKEKSITVVFEMETGFSPDYTRRKVKTQIAKTLELAKDSGISFDSVRCQVVAEVPDKFGNMSKNTYVDVVYSKETVEKINFDGFQADGVYEIADTAEVFHSFR